MYKLIKLNKIAPSQLKQIYTCTDQR